MMEIKEITENEATKIIDSRKPLGLFMVNYSGEMLVGIDNRTGDAWTEEFNSILKCRRWLNE